MTALYYVEVLHTTSKLRTCFFSNFYSKKQKIIKELDMKNDGSFVPPKRFVFQASYFVFLREGLGEGLKEGF